MLLTELAEALVTHLNLSPEKWNDQGVKAKVGLDLAADAISTLKVFVAPNFVQPILDTSRSRGKRVQNTEILFLSLMVAQQFDEIPEEDEEGIANWHTEAKPMIDTWQRAQEFMLKYSNRETTLTTVEPREPEPLELDRRNYVAMTVFGYEQITCISQHELASMSSVSTEGTVLQGIRASIKSQGLSGRQPGGQ